jgi:hypothetical protein
MSTEAIYLESVDLPYTTKEERRTVNASKNNCNVIIKLPSEALYHICFAAEPTPEQIAMEEFLLDCD